MDLETVADELYGLRPADFTSARDAKAAEARTSGDRPLAAQIKALRRPTASAWLANLLARTRSEQVAELLEMGEALRQAQASLSGDDLRRLTAQRYQVVSALAQQARRAAYEQGERVSDAVQQELEGTLEAALADPRAGDAVRLGRLTGALSYSGLGDVDLSSVASVTSVQRAKPNSPTKAAPKAKRSTQADGPTQEERDAQVRRQAEERLAAARERLADAEQAAAVARSEAEEAERKVDELTAEDQQVRERIQALESELDEAQERATRLASAVREAKRTRSAADRSASGAAHRVERAEAAVEAAERELSGTK